MSVRIIDGITDTRKRASVFYDADTLLAFGPVFDNSDDAEDFLRACRLAGVKDVRTLEKVELEKAFLAWRSGRR